MVEKRPLEVNGSDGTRDGPTAGGNASDAKKARTLDAERVPSATPATVGPAVALSKLEALERAKKALQMHKGLLQKIKEQAATPAATGGAVPAAAAPSVAATLKAAQIAANFGAPVTLPGGVTPRPALATQPPGFQPPPLRLVEGREVDAFGNAVPHAQPPATLRVNQRQQLAAALAAPTPEEPTEDVGFDPRLAKGGRKQKRRNRATFDFVQEGTFQKQAEVIRIKGRYGEDAFKKLPAMPFGPAAPGDDPNLVPLGTRAAAPFDANSVPLGVRRPPAVMAGDGAEMAKASSSEEAESSDDEESPGALAALLAAEPVPDVEWWDKALLATGSYDTDVALDQLHIKGAKITSYIAHPVPIEPPAEAPAPPPQPLKLTKRELKKLRTQRRQAREKEKQELIRQGLLEPAKPKVKISNLSRVLGEQAVADPTALEKEVRKQMAERQAAHEDRNLARKLTPAEVAAKKERKLFGSAGVGNGGSDNEEGIAGPAIAENVAAVYRIERLANPRTRYKVDMNAKENRLSGVLLLAEPFALVVVEGLPKAIKRYNKLMLRRINWSLVMQHVEGGGPNEMEEVEEDADDSGVPPNTCSLVWQGVIPKAAFTDFRVEPRGEGPAGGRNKAPLKPMPADDAKQLLQQRGVAHYWDVAAGYKVDEVHARIKPLAATE